MEKMCSFTVIFLIRQNTSWLSYSGPPDSLSPFCPILLYTTQPPLQSTLVHFTYSVTMHCMSQLSEGIKSFLSQSFLLSLHVR